MSADARREQLLDAALAIIVRDGYGAVSIESIAREIDVTRPVIYNVFDDLSALLLALLERHERKAMAQMLAIMPTEPDFSDFTGFLRRMFEDLARMVADDPVTWSPIFAAHPGTPQVVRDRSAAATELVRVRIQMLVELGLSAAGADKDQGDVDPVLMSHALVGIGEYFARMILASPESVDPARLASTIASMLTPVSRLPGAAEVSDTGGAADVSDPGSAGDAGGPGDAGSPSDAGSPDDAQA